VENKALWNQLSAGAVRAASRFDVLTVGRLLESVYAQVLENGSATVRGV
jgi:hypothetical protein